MNPVYVLNPTMPVLLRPDGAVQVGWDPRRAVLIRPPRGLTAAGLAGLLRSMQAPVDVAALRRAAARQGLREPAELAVLLACLVDAGVATGPCPPGAGPERRRQPRSPTLRVHGRGPLTEMLLDALRCSGAVVRHSSQPHATVTGSGTDLVVLSDYLVAEPRMVRELRRAGVPHLAVRVRDGTGLVGPLVVPGSTSCLDCADLHRRDRDAAWPALAVQLRNTVTHAGRPAVLATAALALAQIQQVIAAVRGATGFAGGAPPPPTLNTTLEFDVEAGSIVARHWTRHPLCGC